MKTVNFKYENGQVVQTKLKQKGLIQAMMLGGSDVQYHVLFEDGHSVWIYETDIIKKF